jgi:hypothetical protein
MFWYMLFPEIVHIFRSAYKEEWVMTFLFYEDSDLLSLLLFPLPLPFTSFLSPFHFIPFTLPLPSFAPLNINNHQLGQC